MRVQSLDQMVMRTAAYRLICAVPHPVKRYKALISKSYKQDRSQYLGLDNV